MKWTWSIPIRTWLAIALIAMLLAPVASWLGTLIAVKGPSKVQQSPWERQSEHAREEAIELIIARGGEWDDPTFQRELTAVLYRGGYSAALLDRSGGFLFRLGSITESQVKVSGQWIDVGASGYGDVTHVGLVTGPDGTVAGQYLLVRSGRDPMLYWMVMALIIGVPMVLVLLVWWLGRSFTRPITALAQAAGQVNRGELDFDVPTSRVSELNELSRAFGAMRDGLKASVTRQAELEQERRLFVAAVAHDLRTPLSSVRGYLEGLRDGVAKTPEQVRRYVAVALDKAGVLERLVESFFAYARTEFLEQPPQREELDLSALLQGSVEALRPGAEGKGLRVELYGPMADPLLVSADRQMLSRVIDNLLENAIRYTSEGGVVSVGWDGGPALARFWVQDSGPGIPAGDLGQVFQPLYRGDKARGTRTGGAGLGLAIARRLVEAHGGSISVENRGGARFTVTLPAYDVDGSRLIRGD